MAYKQIQIPKDIKLRGHHLDVVIGEFRGMNVYGTSGWETFARVFYEKKGYSSGNTDKHIAMMGFFRGNPDAEFTIVEGLDTLCEGCNKMRESCSSSFFDRSDRFYLKRYGIALQNRPFEVGDKYKVRDLLSLAWGALKKKKEK